MRRNPLDFYIMIKTIKNILWDKVIIEGEMLDLGAGNGADAIVAVEAGFKVTAVDRNLIPETTENMSVYKVVSPIETFTIEKDRYDFIYADNSLPFLKKTDVEKILQDASGKLKKGGILYFSLFGVNDEWASDENMNFWTREEITDLVSTLGLALYKKVEEEGYVPKMNGETKYAHIFRFTLKK